MTRDYLWLLMSANKSILICRCAERGWIDLSKLPEGLAEDGSVVVLPDLCRAAAEKNSVLEEIAASDSAVVYACRPRAVRALFDYAGAPLLDSAKVVDLRRETAADGEAPEEAPAWYPVIDYNRCSNCGQCHEFCLFGVYEKDAEERVQVVHPGNCKNNCPACARICPEAAIIFPKSAESPINGAEIDDETALKTQIKLNVDEILGDDVYAALEARKQKRRSLLNRKKIEQALEERRNCSGGNS